MINGETTPCDSCGEGTPHCDMVSYGGVDGGYRQLRSRFFNADIARLMWVGELRGLPIRANRTQGR